MPKIAGPAGLHRRPGRLVRLRVHPVHRAAPGDRRRQARRTRHARHPADAQRGSRGVRQPQGPAVPDRARRPARAAGAARAPTAASTNSAHRLRHAGAGYPETLRPDRRWTKADFVSGFTREGFIAAVEKSQGLHPRRRHLPGRAVAAPERAVPGAPGRRVPRAARAQSVAVHVFPRCRRHPGGRLVAGDPGAPAGRRGHRAPDRRHAPARRARTRKTSRSKPSCWPTRRSAPST